VQPVADLGVGELADVTVESLEEAVEIRKGPRLVDPEVVVELCRGGLLPDHLPELRQFPRILA